MSIDAVKLIAIDVDGTITDGNYLVAENGGLSKNFNTRDMHGIYRAAKDGFKIVIITGSTDRVIHAKMGKWGHTIISGSKDKFADLSKHLLDNELTWDNVAYIGDAENDYKCICEAAFSGCPSNAIPEVYEHAMYGAHAKAGDGAVYEIIRYFYRLRKLTWVME